MPNWGKTNTNGSDYSANWCRAMDGNGPDIAGMKLKSVSIYVGATHTAQVRVAIYAGGTLGAPATATLIYDFGLTTGSAINQFLQLDVSGDIDLPQNEVLWISVKGNDSGFACHASSSSADAGDFDIVDDDGRLDSVGISSDETVAYPSTWPTETGTEGAFWYTYYLTWDYGDIIITHTTMAIEATLGNHTVDIPAAWLGTWKYRRKVSVESARVDSSLTWFPVLLKLGSSVGIGTDDVTSIFDEVGSNSKKIAITTDDGTTQIYAEIEEWNSGTEVAHLWVSKSDLVLASGSDTELYFYYDNSKSDNTTYIGDTKGSSPVSEVWDNDFIMVLHMDETSGGTFYDSTDYGHDGVYGAAHDPNVAGFIDGGSYSDGTVGTEDEIVISNTSTLNAMVSGTAELMHETDDNSIDDQVLYSFYADATNRFYTMQDGSEQLETYDGVTAAWYCPTGILPTNNVWYYTSWTIDPTNWVLWVNDAIGDSDASGTDFSDLPDGWSFGIGQRHGQNDRCWLGTVDEARLSKIVRNDAWKKASNYTIRDNFVTWGTEEEGTADINIIHTTNSVDVSLGTHSIAIDVSISHTTDTVEVMRGTHGVLIDVNVSHAVISVGATIGTHSVLIDVSIMHIIISVEATIGTHVTAVDQLISHVVDSVQATLGTHSIFIDIFIIHTTISVEAIVGTHAIAIDQLISHNVNSVNVSLGTHLVIIDVSVIHVADSVEVTLGSHVVTIDQIIPHTSDSVEIITGTHVIAVDQLISHVVDSVEIITGNHAIAVDQLISHVVDSVEITLGTHIVSIGVNIPHTVSNVEVTLGTHIISIDQLISHTADSVDVSLGTHSISIGINILHSVVNVEATLGTHSVIVDISITHTIATIDITSGLHIIAVDVIISHVALIVEAQIGTHSIIVDEVISHTVTDVEISTGTHVIAIDQIIAHTMENVDVNLGTHIAIIGISVLHTVANVGASIGTHIIAVDQLISHIIDTVDVTPGTHSVIVDVSIMHSTLFVKASVGTHIIAIDQLISHIADSVEVTTGTHTVALGVVVVHTVSSIEATLGTHTVLIDQYILHSVTSVLVSPGAHMVGLDVLVEHTVDNVEATRGTHGVIVDTVISHSVLSVEAILGTHSILIDVYIEHMLSIVEVFSGTHVIAVDQIITHTVDSIKMTLGTHSVTIGVNIVHVALNVEAIIGIHTVAIDQIITHTVDSIDVTLGTHSVLIGVSIMHSTLFVKASVGTHGVLINEFILHSVLSIDVTLGTHSVLIDVSIMHTTIVVDVTTGIHITAIGVIIQHVSETVDATAGSHSVSIDQVTVFHTLIRVSVSVGNHYFRVTGDCITAQVTRDLKASLDSLSSYGGTPEIAFERQILAIDERYPYLEICGPYEDFNSQTYNISVSTIEYELKYFVGVNDDNENVGEELTYLTKEVADDIQRNLMRDPQRNGLAKNTLIKAKGNAFEMINHINEFYVYIIVNVILKTNTVDPYEVK